VIAWRPCYSDESVMYIAGSNFTSSNGTDVVPITKCEQETGIYRNASSQPQSTKDFTFHIAREAMDDSCSQAATDASVAWVSSLKKRYGVGSMQDLFVYVDMMRVISATNNMEEKFEIRPNNQRKIKQPPSRYAPKSHNTAVRPC
jgi:hypothetical protein